MKQMSFLGAIVLLLLCACQSNTIENTVTITGEIEKPTGDDVKVYKGEMTHEAQMEDDTFTIEFDIDKPGYYSFKHGPEYSTMYLSPGDALLMTLNTDQFDESISYEGKGSSENNYLAAKYLKDEELTTDLSFKDLFSKEEADFINTIKSLFQKKTSFLEEYASKNIISEDFLKLEKADLSFDFGDKLLSYAEAHAYFTGKENVQNSAEIYNELEDLNINDEAYLALGSFKNYLGSYLQSKVDPQAEDTDPRSDSQAEMLSIIDSEITNQKVKEVAATQTMERALRYGVNDNTKDLMKQYESMMTDKDMLVSVKENYEKWARIAVGNDAPNFSYPDINGENVSLDDLKGKAVYVDVWATWCGPCLKELPHLEELQKEYEGDDRIVFTSISIDENKEAWEKMVKDKEMSGLQLYAEDAWESTINEDYNINGIPRFILIDTQGKIVDANAPRPSSKELKDMLESAINAEKS